MRLIIYALSMISTFLVLGVSVAIADGEQDKQAISKIAGCQAFLRVEAEVRVNKGLDVREEVLKEQENYPMLYVMAMLGMKQRSKLSDKEFTELVDEKHNEAFNKIPRDTNDMLYQSYLWECKQSGTVYQLAKTVRPNLSIKFK